MTDTQRADGQEDAVHGLQQGNKACMGARGRAEAAKRRELRSKDDLFGAKLKARKAAPAASRAPRR